MNPIEAVTHPNPYPYYAELVAKKSIYYDTELGMWVASSAAVVTAVLTSNLCGVRPVAEPVPRALLGSPAATIFQQLLRMNDQPLHCPLKQAVSGALTALDTELVAKQAKRWTELLLTTHAPADFPHALTELAFKLPVYVIGSLLGVKVNNLGQIALWLGDFVGCLAPTSSDEQVERGKIAAGHLIEAFRTSLGEQENEQTESLLLSLALKLKRDGGENTEITIANGIGFLVQVYEATAGLIGNSLLALAARPAIRETVTAIPGSLRQVLLEVLRYDPPVQNTRRFLVNGGMVAGQAMEAGEVILVLLAAANRDPAANPNPENFDILRTDRRIFSFGTGPHACPGEVLALEIAQAAIEELLRLDLAPRQLPEWVNYRPSANGRIPLFFPEETQ